MKKLIISAGLLYSFTCNAQQVAQPQQPKLYIAQMPLEGWQNLLVGLKNSEMASSKTTPIVETIVNQLNYQLELEKQQAEKDKAKVDSISKATNKDKEKK